MKDKFDHYLVRNSIWRCRFDWRKCRAHKCSGFVHTRQCLSHTAAHHILPGKCISSCFHCMILRSGTRNFRWLAICIASQWCLACSIVQQCIRCLWGILLDNLAHSRNIRRWIRVSKCIGTNLCDLCTIHPVRTAVLRRGQWTVRNYFQQSLKGTRKHSCHTCHSTHHRSNKHLALICIRYRYFDTMFPSIQYHYSCNNIRPPHQRKHHRWDTEMTHSHLCLPVDVKMIKHMF